MISTPKLPAHDDAATRVDATDLKGVLGELWARRWTRSRLSRRQGFWPVTRFGLTFAAAVVLQRSAASFAP